MRAVSAFPLLVIAAAASFYAGSLQSRRDRGPAATPVKTAEAPKLLYYVDPMHPAYKSNKAGTAPDCGMALEPVYAGDRAAGVRDEPSTEPGGIIISPEQQQLIGMRVVVAEESSGVERVRLFGRVTADETRFYRVYVGVQGYIRDASSVTTGSLVRKGDFLATLAGPEIRQPVQAYLVTLDVNDRESRNGATPQSALAKAALQQAVDRLLTLGMSPTQIAEIAAKREVVQNMRLTAPADGFVTARNLTVGERVEAATELYRIADLRRLWIVADVPTADAALLKAGRLAHVVLRNGLPSLRARVSGEVLPQFDPATQSAKVRLEADNPGFILRPDMYVDVDIEFPRPPGVLVPAGAVVMSGLHSTVFVERSAGVFEAREVETGTRSGDRIAIVGGVRAGERLAASGAFLLDSETRMKRHDQSHH